MHLCPLAPEVGMWVRLYFLYLGDNETDAMPISLVTVGDPRVIEAVNAAAEKARNSPIEITQEMYMEALRRGISEAETKRKEVDPHGAQ